MQDWCSHRKTPIESRVCLRATAGASTKTSTRHSLQSIDRLPRKHTADPPTLEYPTRQCGDCSYSAYKTDGAAALCLLSFFPLAARGERRKGNRGVRAPVCRLSMNNPPTAVGGIHGVFPQSLTSVVFSLGLNDIRFFHTNHLDDAATKRRHL